MDDLKFTPPHVRKPGTIAAILKRCYAKLVSSDPDFWGSEAEGWEWFDIDVYEDLDGIGECIFLSWWGDDLVGFSSFDPRQWPALGIIGHNAILPDFQGRGFGKQQISETLRRFRKGRFKRAKVSTLDHPFFVPAQKMYLSCGFRESRRFPWKGSPKYQIIEYEQDLG